MAWIVRLVSLGAEGEEHSSDVLQIARPSDLTDLASLGLTLAEGKRLLAGVQQELVAAQARVHAVRRPECRSCDVACRVKDYRQHAIATLFGQVTVRLPRFRCAGCGTIAAGMEWPPHARSTPELDRLRAQLSALLTYRTAAEVLAQMFPVDAGTAHETLRRRTFKVAEELPMRATIKPATPAEMITVTLDSTFIRSCEEGERHLEVRIGNVETTTGRRQVFGAVAKTDTDLAALIRGGLDAVGRTKETVLSAFTDGCPGLRRLLLDAGITELPILARIAHLESADTPKSRGNVGETTDCPFHPSRPSGLGYLFERKTLSFQPKLVHGAGRTPIHLGNPGLDWFHFAMRLQHLTQVAGSLSPGGPERAAAKAVIVEEVERLRWRLWNG
ncbi:MAG TPA: hypothetical protein VFY87_05445, partial [Geminicoccaceae bacterium]|nr:hypothetical protein [Geminicoccaceae bacterium]